MQAHGIPLVRPDKRAARCSGTVPVILCHGCAAVLGAPTPLVLDHDGYICCEFCRFSIYVPLRGGLYVVLVHRSRRPDHVDGGGANERKLDRLGKSITPFPIRRRHRRSGLVDPRCLPVWLLRAFFPPEYLADRRRYGRLESTQSICP